MAQRKDARESAREDSGGRLSDVADQAQQSIERLENAFGAFWQEASGDDTQPYLRQVARANMEVIRLMGRQTRALAELPARLVQCHTPHEVWAEHLQFLRSSFSDYQSATGRIMEAVTTTAVRQVRDAEEASMGRRNGRDDHRSERDSSRRSGD